jgi:hypothetical protein
MTDEYTSQLMVTYTLISFMQTMTTSFADTQAYARPSKLSRNSSSGLAYVATLQLMFAVATLALE